MGGAQPLAATMAGASRLAIECQPSRIDRRLATGYLDRRADGLDDAMAMLRDAKERRQAVSIGLLGNAAELVPELARRGGEDAAWLPDVVTHQTSAPDPLNRSLPAG